MKRGLVVALGLALVLTVSRLLWLEADPPVTKRSGDLANEGYWVHNARMKILTGEFRHDHFNQALVTAPLYTALTYGVFRLTGVGLASGRLVSAISGVLIIAVGFLFLWRGCCDLGWAAAFALLLSVNDLFFAYNRLGLVETALVSFVFLAFILLCLGLERRVHWLYLSGVSFGLATLVKFTGLYVLASFVMVGIFEWLAGRRLGWRQVLAWLAGLASPLVPFAVIMQMVYPGEFWRYLTIYSPAVGGGGGVYSRVVPLVFNPLRVVRNEFVTTLSVAILLVMLLIAVLEATRQVPLRPGALLGRLGAFERLSLAWILGVGLSSAYVNLGADRRYWMILVPLVVLVSRVVADVLDWRGQRSPPPPGEPRSHDRGAGWIILKVLVAAGLVYWSAPLLAQLAQQGLGALGALPRLGIIQAASLAVMVVVVLAGVGPGFHRRAWYLLIVPLAAFAIEWTLSLVAATGSSPTTTSWLAIVALAGGIAYGLSRVYQRGLRPVIVALLAAYLVWNVAVVGQVLAMPNLTIAAAAREVDRVIATVDTNRRYYIAGANAHQLALESQSLPLFIGLGTFYTELTKGLREHPEMKPQYYLQAPTVLGSRRPADVSLPPGMEGRVIGWYCRFRHGWTDVCNDDVAVVKLTAFSLSELLASEHGGAGRENPAGRSR